MNKISDCTNQERIVEDERPLIEERKRRTVKKANGIESEVRIKVHLSYRISWSTERETKTIEVRIPIRKRQDLEE